MGIDSSTPVRVTLAARTTPNTQSQLGLVSFGEGWRVIIVVWWSAVKRSTAGSLGVDRQEDFQGHQPKENRAQTHSCGPGCGSVPVQAVWLSCEPSLPYTTAGWSPVEPDAGARRCTRKKADLVGEMMQEQPQLAPRAQSNADTPCRSARALNARDAMQPRVLVLFWNQVGGEPVTGS